MYRINDRNEVVKGFSLDFGQKIGQVLKRKKGSLIMSKKTADNGLLKRRRPWTSVSMFPNSCSISLMMKSRQAAAIIKGILEAQSPRLSNISEKMAGHSNRNYKVIQRFLEKVDLQRVLLKLYQEQAEFVIGDPTEMERYRAPQTSYVGTLSDGKTAGYWLMVLSTPFRGRSLPCAFVVYSSKTIGAQSTSRNQEHMRCFAAVKELLGERPLVLDREFSYAELMASLQAEDIQFVIHLNLGDVRKRPRLVDADGEPLKFVIKPGETIVRSKLYYLDTVMGTLIGYWRKGLSKPLWIITSLEPKLALEIYLQRMKIEETFRDCKDLPHLNKLMNKKKAILEQMIALLLLAYVVGVSFGEAIRDVVYGQTDIAHLAQALLHQPLVDFHAHPKWRLNSGLFILLKQKLRLSNEQLDAVTHAAASAFATLLYDRVRTFV